MFLILTSRIPVICILYLHYIKLTINTIYSVNESQTYDCGRVRIRQHNERIKKRFNMDAQKIKHMSPPPLSFFDNHPSQNTHHPVLPLIPPNPHEFSKSCQRSPD